MKRFPLALGVSDVEAVSLREVNRIFRERMTAGRQAREIRQTWPSCTIDRRNPVRSIFTMPERRVSPSLSSDDATLGLSFTFR